MIDARVNAVERFYDFHPINARQILDAVAARGMASEAITEEVLQQHDQDHYGGTAATDRLIAEAAVRADDLVLDVCSGMGGPARYARLGREHFERYDRAYEHFVGLYRSGVLAGALIHARKDGSA